MRTPTYLSGTARCCDRPRLSRCRELDLSESSRRLYAESWIRASENTPSRETVWKIARGLLDCGHGWSIVSKNSTSWPLFTGLQSPTGALIRISRDYLSRQLGDQQVRLLLHPRQLGLEVYMASIVRSISLASALTSFFISFLACLIVSSRPRSIVSSPITIKAASLSSSISPISLRSERDIPPLRWPMSAPAPAPTSPLTSTEGGKMRPIAAPTANPAHPPCWVGFSILSTISTLPSSFLVRTAAS